VSTSKPCLFCDKPCDGLFCAFCDRGQETQKGIPTIKDIRRVVADELAKALRVGTAPTNITNVVSEHPAWMKPGPDSTCHRCRGPLQGFPMVFARGQAPPVDMWHALERDCDRFRAGAQTPALPPTGTYADGAPIHTLKCDYEAYNSIAAGRKLHEIRENDRGFDVAHVLHLRQTAEGNREKFTGRNQLVRVTYMTPGGAYGLPDEMCVMSISRIADEAEAPATEIARLRAELDSLQSALRASEQLRAEEREHGLQTEQVVAELREQLDRLRSERSAAVATPAPGVP